MINLLMENGEYNQLTELLSNRNNLHIIFAKSREKDNSSIFERNDFCRIIDKQKKGLLRNQLFGNSIY